MNSLSFMFSFLFLFLHLSLSFFCIYYLILFLFVSDILLSDMLMEATQFIDLVIGVVRVSDHARRDREHRLSIVGFCRFG